MFRGIVTGKLGIFRTSHGPYYFQGNEDALFLLRFRLRGSIAFSPIQVRIKFCSQNDPEYTLRVKNFQQFK